MKANILTILSLFLFGTFLCRSQVYKVHSHNDYEQNVPFWKAISAGVYSIEADVFLKNGNLLVAHEPESITDSRTLKRLYLEPLKDFLDLGPVNNSPLQFLIDIKSDAEPTLDAIVTELKEYPMITDSKDITIVISGNRPDSSQYYKYPDFISFDYQSLELIDDPTILNKVGLISLSFRSFTDWNGKGRLTKEDLEKVSQVVARAHAFGKPFRFWATPDSKTAWKAMVALGVDYLNTDHPFECVTYVNSLEKRVFENTGISSVYSPTFSSDGSTHTPENIILLIGDGNGLAQISATALANGGNLSLTQLRNIGFLKTQSGDDFTTDSAGAGTALATGQKVPNRYIGRDSDRKSIPNLTEILDKKGFSTAIITTDEITGATPASFFAHQKDRSLSDAILKDLEKSSLELFVAGSPTPETASKNFYGFEKVADLESLHLKRSAYFFPPDTIPAPLHTAVSSVLETLNNAKKPFFLMVEGAKIDSYGHANNIDGIIKEGIAFDRAVTEALKFADADSNTLVIITADHETGGLTLPQGDVDNHTIEADFTTDDHTGIFVPIFAYGPQSQRFQGVYGNHEVYYKIQRVLGLE